MRRVDTSSTLREGGDEDSTAQPTKPRSPPPFLSVAAIPPPITLPQANRSSSSRMAGMDSSTTSYPSAIEEYRTTDAHLNKRIGDVRAVLDDFFEDVDLAVVQKSLENRGHTTRLEQVASALRRVPLLRDADWQTFPPQKVYAHKKVKKQSIMNLFSNLIDREQDRRLLTLDLTMLLLGALTILLMLVADYLTWVVPTVPIASISKTITLALPPSNVTVAPAPTGNTPVPAFTPAPAGSTTIQNVIGSVQVGTIDILYYINFALSLLFLLVLTRYYRLRLQ
ncbi:transmembrane protein, putative, partial [Bodo saltans]